MLQLRQPATTYVARSVVTGVSSGCNLADYDISKYKEMVDKLGDLSVEIESTLDGFPAGSGMHQNDQFSQARRDRDLANEDESLAMIETLLSRYQEQTNRLDDVRSDGEEEIQDDAVEVGSGVEVTVWLARRKPPRTTGLAASRGSSRKVWIDVPDKQLVPIRRRDGSDPQRSGHRAGRSRHV